MSVKVLFVCLGNICRSPTAHALFQARVNAATLSHRITVDSAGTGSWHIGLPPDERAQKTALAHGYDISHLRARQVVPADFGEFDYILGMDNNNLSDLHAMRPTDAQGVVGLFLTESGNSEHDEVPDPYYGDEQHFENVMHLITSAVDGLLTRIINDHGL